MTTFSTKPAGEREGYIVVFNVLKMNLGVYPVFEHIFPSHRRLPMTAKSIVNMVKFGFFVVIPVVLAVQAGILPNIVSALFSLLRSF